MLTSQSVICVGVPRGSAYHCCYTFSCFYFVFYRPADRKKNSSSSPTSTYQIHVVLEFNPTLPLHRDLTLLLPGAGACRRDLSIFFSSAIPSPVSGIFQRIFRCTAVLLLYNLLFERSEFLIATSKKKKTDRLCVRMVG